MKNSLQAILDREAAAPPDDLPIEAPPPAANKHPTNAKPKPAHSPAEPAKFHRPSRDGRRFMGGHFSPEVLKQMKLLAVEEDTTTQALLEEALNLLFVKKGKGRIIGV
ncbi:ribbon-helix-helix domain-containing protein [Roseomonas marmotae]|uniref:Antitoxin-like ribbon-helix-helix domain-containing protein n=1 Tax=Roseomonas marmotae TaxID=2768161 RepID=A0ABS3KHJ3_9PROT|nr:ribbon-helix-helix domain-containing protein [Roseomonas marmotae]MBO1076929.1 hypothetical protein [Roseomonas marmotae]QTI82037.1 hypothetical protein IAI58_22000 [Roseomonas marmotae]